MPTADNALPGRDVPVPVPPVHEVLGQPLSPPFPDDSATIVVGMGCFWGAERVFWETTGVLTTAVGYGGGFTRNPTYEEVCSGLTGHNEVVLAVYDPNVVTYSEMLKLFWENHDPTQGMRQGNDLGTQYRSGIYVSTELERTLAETSRQEFQSALSAAGFGTITTEILDAVEFF